MRIGVGTKLQKVTAHVDQATIIFLEERKEEIRLLHTSSQSYKPKISQWKTIWTERKKWRPSMNVSWIQNGDTTSILEHSRAKIVRKLWIAVPISTKVNRLLDSIDMAKQCNKMTALHVSPGNSAPHHAVPKNQTLRRQK